MCVLMYMCVYVSINVIDTSFLYLVHHIGHTCIVCPVRPNIFALARMHRMNIIMPSVVILAWPISHPQQPAVLFNSSKITELKICSLEFWKFFERALELEYLLLHVQSI